MSAPDAVIWSVTTTDDAGRRTALMQTAIEREAEDAKRTIDRMRRAGLIAPEIVAVDVEHPGGATSVASPNTRRDTVTK